MTLNRFSKIDTELKIFLDQTHKVLFLFKIILLIKWNTFFFPPSGDKDKQSNTHSHVRSMKSLTFIEGVGYEAGINKQTWSSTREAFLCSSEYNK